MNHNSCEAPKGPMRRLPRQPLRCALGAALLAAGLPALAMQPLITDDTGTQGAGAQQIELGGMHARQAAGPERSRADGLGATYTVGAIDTLDLYAGQGFVRNRDDAMRTSGWGGANLGLKWRFYENDATGTSLGLKPEWLTPVGREREARGLGPGRGAHMLTLLASQQLPFGALHANYAWGRERGSDPATDLRHQRLSAALVWDVAERWKLAVDAGLLRHTPRDGERQRSRYAELGLVYSVHPQWDVAAGVIRSRDARPAVERTTATTTTVGLTGRF